MQKWTFNLVLVVISLGVIAVGVTQLIQLNTIIVEKNTLVEKLSTEKDALSFQLNVKENKIKELESEINQIYESRNLFTRELVKRGAAIGWVARAHGTYTGLDEVYASIDRIIDNAQAD